MSAAVESSQTTNVKPLGRRTAQRLRFAKRGSWSLGFSSQWTRDSWFNEQHFNVTETKYLIVTLVKKITSCFAAILMVIWQQWVYRSRSRMRGGCWPTAFNELWSVYCGIMEKSLSVSQLVIQWSWKSAAFCGDGPEHAALQRTQMGDMCSLKNGQHFARTAMCSCQILMSLLWDCRASFQHWQRKDWLLYELLAVGEKTS